MKAERDRHRIVPQTLLRGDWGKEGGRGDRLGLKGGLRRLERGGGGDEGRERSGEEVRALQDFITVASENDEFGNPIRQAAFPTFRDRAFPPHVLIHTSDPTL